MKHPICKLLLIALLALVTTLSANAQSLEELTVTASFNNQSTKRILEQLGAQLPVQFYYKEAELPTTAKSVTFEDATLADVLNALFEGTLLNYLVYRDYAIIIAPDRILQEVYTSDYYEGLEQSLSSQNDPPRIKALQIGTIENLAPSGKAVMKGVITDEQTREEIIGATIIITNLENKGTITDVDGSFELELPVGDHEMLIQYVGYDDKIQPINVLSDGEVKIRVTKAAVQLDEVTVSARRQDANVEQAQIGVTALDMGELKKLPTFLGEADLVKGLLLQPGISSIGEGAAGFNVRGGDVDQNLVLQDEGFLFNSSHALGFFSTFNADLVSSVELFKGNIPAKYGGRVASVMDVRMRDGDFDRFRLKGGIGPVTSKLSFEGPVVKEKISFIAGVRSSYSDWILSRINEPEVQNSSAFFYDANARMTFRLNEKNTVIVSGYASADEFTYNNEFGFEYSTLLGQASYRKIFSDNVLSNLSLVASQYESSQFDLEGIDAAQLDNNVSYLKAKEQLTFTPSNNLQLDAGLTAIYYQVDPGKQSPFSEESAIIPSELEQEQGLETSAFVAAEWAATPRLLVAGGLRVVLYQFLGPKTVFDYENTSSPSLIETVGSTNFSNGEAIETYSGIEPRISARYKLNTTSSIKAGYSRTNQFINQIFNSDSPTPTSQWQLSTNYIEPVRSHNFSLGFFKNFQNDDWQTSAEVYYRDVDALFDYKDFADITVNPQLETELLTGVGRSYGLELSVKKTEGVINGFISYSLTRSERQVVGINSGDWYPSNFDKPNDLSILINYQPNRRNTLAINFIYGSGRPTTPPVGNFSLPNGLIVPIYSLRNQQRIPDYHRLDVAYTIGRGYKKDQRFRTSWTISIYNVYGRRNAFSVFYTQAAFRSVEANRLAILGSAFPSLTFNFEIL